RGRIPARRRRSRAAARRGRRGGRPTGYAASDHPDRRGARTGAVHLEARARDRGPARDPVRACARRQGRSRRRPAAAAARRDLRRVPPARPAGAAAGRGPARDHRAARCARPGARLSRPLPGVQRHVREYVFVDEWDVDAPPAAVFDALADARTYPEWWKPVYLDVETDGPPELGRVSRQHFKGRLPYHLRTTSRITRYEPPHAIGADVEGDLRGTGLWTLTPL